MTAVVRSGLRPPALPRGKTGEHDTAGAFAEASLPLADTVDVRAAARADESDDVGGLRAWRLGAEYRPSDIVTLRGWGRTYFVTLNMRF